MKKRAVIISVCVLAFFSFQCTTYNPVTGQNEIKGASVFKVEILPNVPSRDIYTITLVHGLAISDRNLSMRLRYEANIIADEKGYVGYLVENTWFESYLVNKTIFEVRFVKTEEEFDKWNNRLKR